MFIYKIRPKPKPTFNEWCLFFRSRLNFHLKERSISFEDVIEIEYIERFPVPEPQDCLLHDDWVSAVETNGKW